MAARIKPIRGKVRFALYGVVNICCISQEFKFVANQAMEKIKPMSPMRL